MTVTCRAGDYSCGSGGYSGSEPWGYYTAYGSVDGAGRRHNCTTYAAYQMARAGVSNPGRNFADATSWAYNADKIGWPVSQQPAIGAIAQWNDGSGHVARVEAVDSGGITVTDDNFRLNVTTKKRIAFGSVGWPDNFLLSAANAPTHFYGDWDGNGTVTSGVVRRVNGVLQWHLRNGTGSGPADIIFSYGLSTDIPIVGNWDGVGGDTIGIARRVNGALEWHLRNYNSSGPANIIFAYGNDSTDMPLVGNWDGVGGDTIGIARRVSGVLQFHLRNYNSAGPANMIFGYGNDTTDMPIVGNWDGVGGDTIGVARRTPSGVLEWHLRNYNSSGPADVIFGYGNSTTDIPIVGNWDGVGGDTIGIVRTVSGVLQWHLRNYNSAGPANLVYGYGGGPSEVYFD